MSPSPGSEAFDAELRRQLAAEAASIDVAPDGLPVAGHVESASVRPPGSRALVAAMVALVAVIGGALAVARATGSGPALDVSAPVVSGPDGGAAAPPPGTDPAPTCQTGDVDMVVAGAGDQPPTSWPLFDGRAVPEPLADPPADLLVDPPADPLVDPPVDPSAPGDVATTSTAPSSIGNPTPTTTPTTTPATAPTPTPVEPAGVPDALLDVDGSRAAGPAGAAVAIFLENTGSRDCLVYRWPVVVLEATNGMALPIAYDLGAGVVAEPTLRERGEVHGTDPELVPLEQGARMWFPLVQLDHCRTEVGAAARLLRVRLSESLPESTAIDVPSLASFAWCGPQDPAAEVVVGDVEWVAAPSGATVLSVPADTTTAPPPPA